MGTYKTINITKARKQLGDIITEVCEKGTVICLSRRDDKVAVLPYHYLELLDKSSPPEKKLAVAFVEFLFNGAPQHLKTAQLSEIEALPLDNAIHVLTIRSLPIDAVKREKLTKLLGKKFLERLEKRYEVAQVIKKAEKEGLYDIIEHTTGVIDYSE
jgi:hypothetical protein